MEELQSVQVVNLKADFLKSCTNPDLSKKVLEQIDDDESVFQYPNDYRDASGGVSGFIYYAETLKFAKENLFLITNALNAFENECGRLEKPQDDETQYYNWMSWFALENTIDELINFLENQ